MPILRHQPPPPPLAPLSALPRPSTVPTTMSSPPPTHSQKSAPVAGVANITLSHGVASFISPAAVPIGAPAAGTAAPNPGDAPGHVPNAPPTLLRVPGADFIWTAEESRYASFIMKPLESSKRDAATHGPEAARVLMSVGVDIIICASGGGIAGNGDEEEIGEAPPAKFLDTLFSPNYDGSMLITSTDVSTINHLTALCGEPIIVGPLRDNVRIGYTIEPKPSAANRVTKYTLSFDANIMRAALSTTYCARLLADSFETMRIQSVLPEPKPNVPLIVNIANNPIIAANNTIIAGNTMSVMLSGSNPYNTPCSIAAAYRDDKSGALVYGTAKLIVQTTGRAPVCVDCCKFASDRGANKIGNSRAACHSPHASAIVNINGAAQLVSACIAFRNSENLTSRMAVAATAAPGAAGAGAANGNGPHRYGNNNSANSYSGVTKKAAPARKLSNIGAVMRAKQQQTHTNMQQ
jgi:hypothetical protein